MLSSRPKHTNLRIETLLCPPIIDSHGQKTSSITTTATSTTSTTTTTISNNNLDLPFFHLPLPSQTITAVALSAQRSRNLLATQTSSPSPRNPSKVLESCALPCSYNLTVKAKRKRASPWQTAALEQVFKQTEFPSSSIRAELGLRLGMTPRTIQIWFQNKRQATKRSTTTTAAATIGDGDFHAGYQDHRHLHYYRQQQHQQVYITTP